MKRMMLLFAILALAVSGCTMVERPLAEEMYYTAPLPPESMTPVKASIAVVPFEEGRMSVEAGRDASTGWAWNLLPLVTYTTRYDARPEATHSCVECGMFSCARAVGDFTDAIPRLLADQMDESGLFTGAMLVDDAQQGGGDYVVRGKLVTSKLCTTRITYGLGPLAVVPYVLGLPCRHYAASLAVEWEVYDRNGKLVGTGYSATLTPIRETTGFYYGWTEDGKDVPLGLYIEAAKQVNTQIMTGVHDAVVGR